MKYFREENIRALCNSMFDDEFEELKQYEGEGFDPAFLFLLEFVKRNIRQGRVLDIGCGSGASFSIFPVTHAVEPNKKRYDLACKKARDIIVKLGFSEALPFKKGTFSTVFMINTFNHVRSEFETLIEINKVLEFGGHFVFNVTGDEVDVYAGRAGFAPRNWRRLFRDYGFEFIEYRELRIPYVKQKETMVTEYAVCVEKVEGFNAQNLRKMQIVNFHDLKSGNLYKINNFFPNGRDWRLK